MTETFPDIILHNFFIALAISLACPGPTSYQLPNNKLLQNGKNLNTNAFSLLYFFY